MRGIRAIAKLLSVKRTNHWRMEHHKRRM